MGALSWWHWAIVLIVVIILFGSKKLPEAARGLGRSMRIFKSEMQEMANDGDSKSAAEKQHELTSGDADVNVDVNVTRNTAEDKKSA